MSTLSSSERAELIRMAILEFLAPRQAVTIELATLVERLNRSSLLDFRAEAQEIISALTFLEGLNPPLVSHQRSRVGRTLYYQATSAGVLAHERGAIEESN